MYRIRSTTDTRRTVVGAFFALMLPVPSQGSAQVLQSFEDLALRVNLDDQLQVEDRSARDAKNARTLRSWPAALARASDLPWGRSCTGR